MDTIDKGVGNLIDADLSEESTRLQALQTKQQLGVQALSIANPSRSTSSVCSSKRRGRDTHGCAGPPGFRAVAEERPSSLAGSGGRFVRAAHRLRMRAHPFSFATSP